MSTDEFDGNDHILIATKLLYLCNLSYYNSVLDNKYKEKEEIYLKALNIENYKTWNLQHQVEGKANEVFSQAISGFIPNTCQQYKEKVPFICFRGTVSFHDMLADILSVIPILFKSKKGTKIASTGAGMYATYKQIVDQGLIEFLLDCLENSPALFITGHSLGGALANLLTAELLSDYSHLFQNKILWLVTFGCPRVFDENYASVISLPTATNNKKLTNKKSNNSITLATSNSKMANFKHLRFINDKDIITALPPKDLPFMNKSTMKIFEIVHGHTRLFHPSACCQIYFLPWQQTEWSIIDSQESRSFNFAPDPNYSDFWSATESYLLFVVSLGSIHKTDTFGGYIEKMHNTTQYILAYEKLKTVSMEDKDLAVYESFKLAKEKISNDIPTSDIVFFTLSQAVRFGIEFMRINDSKNKLIKPQSRTSFIYSFLKNNKITSIIGFILTIFLILKVSRYFEVNNLALFNLTSNDYTTSSKQRKVSSSVHISTKEMFPYLEAFTIGIQNPNNYTINEANNNININISKCQYYSKSYLHRHSSETTRTTSTYEMEQITATTPGTENTISTSEYLPLVTLGTEIEFLEFVQRYTKIIKKVSSSDPICQQTTIPPLSTYFSWDHIVNYWNINNTSLNIFPSFMKNHNTYNYLKSKQIYNFFNYYYQKQFQQVPLSLYCYPTYFGAFDTELFLNDCIQHVDTTNCSTTSSGNMNITHEKECKTDDLNKISNTLSKPKYHKVTLDTYTELLLKNLYKQTITKTAKKQIKEYLNKIEPKIKKILKTIVYEE